LLSVAAELFLFATPLPPSSATNLSGARRIDVIAVTAALPHAGTNAENYGPGREIYLQREIKLSRRRLGLRGLRRRRTRRFDHAI